MTVGLGYAPISPTDYAPIGYVVNLLAFNQKNSLQVRVGVPNFKAGPTATLEQFNSWVGFAPICGDGHSQAHM
jgi:hypothetical protein